MPEYSLEIFFLQNLLRIQPARERNQILKLFDNLAKHLELSALFEIDLKAGKEDLK